jgi:hypothetical protein
LPQQTQVQLGEREWNKDAGKPAWRCARCCAIGLSSEQAASKHAAKVKVLTLRDTLAIMVIWPAADIGLGLAEAGSRWFCNCLPEP